MALTEKSGVKRFIRAYNELKDDPALLDREDGGELIPFAALSSVIVYAMEQLSQRTEIECKKEIYYALGKTPPDNDQLLRQPSRD